MASWCFCLCKCSESLPICLFCAALLFGVDGALNEHSRRRPAFEHVISWWLVWDGLAGEAHGGGPHASPPWWALLPLML